METQIKQLQEKVKAANTADSNGRQLVADASKTLYNLIEKRIHEKYGSKAINDAYNDLCNGNFAEPFMCEKQKGKIELYAKIYIENILPPFQLIVKEKINGSGEPIKYGEIITVNLPKLVGVNTKSLYVRKGDLNGALFLSQRGHGSGGAGDLCRVDQSTEIEVNSKLFSRLKIYAEKANALN